MRKVLIDTGAYTNYLVGDQKALDAIVRADTVYMSVFVLGELYSGFKRTTKELKNRELLERFLLKPTVEVLNATSETSEIYSMIVHFLKEAGLSMPVNGIWIAAQALETGSILVTYESHFKPVPGLRVWDYCEPPTE